MKIDLDALGCSEETVLCGMCETLMGLVRTTDSTKESNGSSMCRMTSECSRFP